jgi:hypothetical protein
LKKYKNIIVVVSVGLAAIMSLKNCESLEDLAQAKADFCNVEFDTITEVRYDTIRIVEQIPFPVQIIKEKIVIVEDEEATALIDSLQKDLATKSLELKSAIAQLKETGKIDHIEKIHNYKETFRNNDYELSVDVKAKGEILPFGFTLDVFKESVTNTITVNNKKKNWLIGIEAGGAFIEDSFRPSFGIDLSKGVFGGGVTYIAPVSGEQAILNLTTRINIRL